MYGEKKLVEDPPCDANAESNLIGGESWGWKEQYGAKFVLLNLKQTCSDQPE
jgi:hypothetical protein